MSLHGGLLRCVGQGGRRGANSAAVRHHAPLEEGHRYLYRIRKAHASTRRPVPARRACAVCFRLGRGLAIDVARDIGLFAVRGPSSMSLRRLSSASLRGMPSCSRKITRKARQLGIGQGAACGPSHLARGEVGRDAPLEPHRFCRRRASWAFRGSLPRSAWRGQGFVVGCIGNGWRTNSVNGL
jgi:hypothetical protein